MLKTINKKINSIADKGVASISQEIESLKLLNSKIIIEQIRQRGVLHDIKEAEFSVFSQYGDDGIIQYLISVLGISSKIFIEFGVQDYSESNTKFLLMNNNWRGLIIDGGEDYINTVKQSNLYWKYDLTAVHSFITKENINSLFNQYGFKDEIGILSVDIDGNDYWVWEAINTVKPIIVITEYNSVFGADHAITVPYDKDFYRTNAHFSNLYWGASLGAFDQLAKQKGYTLIGSNSNGNNAYFVRTDKLCNLKPLTVKEAYVESRFRESRNEKNELTYIAGNKRLETIRSCEVFNLANNNKITIKELYKL